MRNTRSASLALLASTAVAHSVGKAVVINMCSYDVHLCNVPAADGGFTEIDKILATEEKYEQTWTELTNGNGWSLKLSNSSSLEYIMQYEYTFHNDGIIWYDLSDVNGNPWNGDWEVTADSAICAPKQQAYRYSTDDAYGMQACPQQSVITVTLCSGNSNNDAAAASASASVSSIIASASAAGSSYPASSTTDTATTTPIVNNYVASTPTTAAIVESSTTSVQSTPTSTYIAPTVTPTTLATSTIAVVTSVPLVFDGAIIETIIVTDIVTTTQWQPARRSPYHEHHARHPHAHA